MEATPSNAGKKGVGPMPFSNRKASNDYQAIQFQKKKPGQKMFQISSNKKVGTSVGSQKSGSSATYGAMNTFSLGHKNLNLRTPTIRPGSTTLSKTFKRNQSSQGFQTMSMEQRLSLKKKPTEAGQPGPVTSRSQNVRAQTSGSNTSKINSVRSSISNNSARNPNQRAPSGSYGKIYNPAVASIGTQPAKKKPMQLNPFSTQLKAGAKKKPATIFSVNQAKN